MIRRVLRMVVLAGAAGLVLATLFALGARLWWAFDLFSHFRLQYVVAALILCPLALALRAPITAGVLVVVALVHAAEMKELWLGGPPANGRPHASLRVASANVLNGNETPGKVRDWVRASGADLVVLVDAQRDRWQGVLSAIGETYPHRAPADWEEGAPIILFSRHPIRRAEVVRPTGGRRPYLVARVAVGGGEFTVVGVHASSPSPRDATDTRIRNLQLAYIAESVEDRDHPTVLAGDFNSTPWSPHFEDLIAEAGLENAANGHGYIGTWPRWLWPVRIPLDHVLIKGPLAAVDFRRGPSIGSDHFPVVADLALLPD